LRALAIAAVVIGHWLLTDVRYHDGILDGVNAISYVSWSAWVTVVLQMVPIFFLVGGFANAISWGRQTRSWRVWLRLRMRRLLGPTVTYMTIAVAAVALAQLTGVLRRNVYQAAWALAFHLWFLAAYIVLIALTPLLCKAHRRWGFAVPLVMSTLALLISAAIITWHWHVVGWANYLFVWGTFHQLGFAWQGGDFARRRWLAPALTAIALTALVALVWPGPYPLNMVGVPGADIQNPSPPSAALLAFGLTQCGLALTAERAANNWITRHRSARALARHGASLTMPVYLWHMVPVVVVSVIAYPSGLLDQLRPGSGAWLAQRVLWIAVLAAVLATLVAVLTVARQTRARRTRARRKDSTIVNATAAVDQPAYPSILLAGVAFTVASLARLAINGFAPSGRVDLATLAIFFIGVAMVFTPWWRGGSQPSRRQAGASACGGRQISGPRELGP
jgi:surface polysaccharide O-acyltransferase-like enzyme